MWGLSLAHNIRRANSGIDFREKRRKGHLEIFSFLLLGYVWKFRRLEVSDWEEGKLGGNKRS